MQPLPQASKSRKLENQRVAKAPVINKNMKVEEKKGESKSSSINGSQNDGKRVLPAWFGSPAVDKKSTASRKRKYDQISDNSESEEPSAQSLTESIESQGKQKKNTRRLPARPAKRAKKKDIAKNKSLIIEGKRPRRKPKY